MSKEDRRCSEAPRKLRLLSRRELIRAAAANAAAAIPARDAKTKGPKSEQQRTVNMYSPWNAKRPRRPYTKYIVLHTTEGEEEGALRKIRRYGEAHYCVVPTGIVYRIIDLAKIAAHAGRSMWEGHRSIDSFSVGIEVVGYHDRAITPAQYHVLRILLDQLKRTYAITDRNVLTHSMVAYGRPNRFHPNNHRGRKRCGMIFAQPSVRAKLGLNDGPGHDMDVESGRLKVGDPQLYAYLFSAAHRPAVAAAATPADLSSPSESSVVGGEWTVWRIARERYNSPETTYVHPDGTRLRGDEVRDWSAIPAGTKVLLSEPDQAQEFEGFMEIGKDGDTPRDLAGDGYAGSTTVYFFPDGLIRTGEELKRRTSTRSLLQKPPPGTRLLVGYIYGGYVRTRRPASAIAGQKWNYPSTYYRFPDGSIVSGDEVNPASIPAGTLVFFQY